MEGLGALNLLQNFYFLFMLKNLSLSGAFLESLDADPGQWTI
jgi:hypothetical protein